MYHIFKDGALHQINFTAQIVLLHSLEYANADLPNIEIDKVVFLVIHKATEITPHETVPDSATGKILKLFLDDRGRFLR